MKANITTVVRSFVITGALLITFSAAHVKAAPPPGLDLGILSGFAFVDLGNSTLGWNSGPIAGNVLLGLGVDANLSGGNNGGLTNGGQLFHDSTANISGALQNPVTQVLVPLSFTQDAATTAQNIATAASALAATQTFTTINGTTTITGNGGLNVIDVDNIDNAKLTLSGGPMDFFVFNVSDQIHTNQPMSLIGITPEQILFNLTGTGTVFQTSGGDVSFGTYLAANGGDFQFSQLELTGRLITIGGDVQFVSGSEIPAIPEPATFALVSIGAIALLCATKARLGKK